MIMIDYEDGISFVFVYYMISLEHGLKPIILD